MSKALRSWWRDIEPWYFVVGLANLVLGTSSVLIPLSVAKVFNHSVGSVGLLASLVSLVGVLGSLIWGRLSDASYRRKPFIVLGYAAAGLCFLGVSLAGSFRQLAVLNMLLNFFWVANASVTVLIAIENSRESSWEGRISRLNQIGAMGWVLGLASGSLWMTLMPQHLGELTAIRLLFWAMGLIGLSASLFAVVSIPRTVPKFTQRKFRGIRLAIGNFMSERARYAPLHLYHRLHPKRVWAMLTHPEGFRPGTKRFLLSTLIAFVAFGFFGIPLPLLLSQKFGMPSSSVFVLFLLQHIGIVLAYPLASRRIRKLGNRYVQMGSLWVRALLFGSFSVYLALQRTAPPTAVLLAGFVIYGIAWSYFQLSGIALTSRLASEKNRGLALGLYNAIAGTGWILAGLGSGLVTERFGYFVSFAIAAGLLAVGLGVLSTVPDPSAVATGSHPKGSQTTIKRWTPATRGLRWHRGSH